MATYQAVSINQRPPQLVDSGFYADIRFDASDAQPTYIGLNILKGADTASQDWKIYKFTYSGSDTTQIQLAYGSWDNRATYF